ncbi:single-stranded-DNA-specific exonuclease RecJ [Pseudanabaena sp. PCC 6802]|uniref:single-stranded-DNA-specific exonuclease RecJ n=1 Tax=Pseudanabaena sp. PCC 6802 TaxID=118173 RepID=UPI00034902BC|nr:single-stranded-DNA-specific exonuclease RecJ [Pseudanabaena sp. PCC 6802]
MALPNQRWQISPSNPLAAEAIARATGLSPLLAQVLINRGMDTPELAKQFLDPESEYLSDPKREFADLDRSLDLLETAIERSEQIAICGDYDADGMTSTALLIRAFRLLGANAKYAIPSRMQEGYGINKRIVEELHQEGVTLILTVDNGIAAYDAIACAKELGISVIVTDHHDIPPQLPPADAILNPKLLDPDSQFAAIAGVGVAYVLALELADRFGQREKLAQPLLELFTLGTIADLAQLRGVNRRLVKQGLGLLARSQLTGVQALIQVSGIAGEKQTGLKPEAIGFGLGPRINAVGRIGDPVTVIELLTTDDMGVALERAMQCEAINKQRQEKCTDIEQEAIALVEGSNIDLTKERVLVVVKDNWHHGVIGIVASRLVERYGVPVFIGACEEDGNIRFSVRSIPEFNVFESLEFIKDIRGKGGGHPAAGGFTLPQENLEQLRDRLREFAHQCLQPEHLKPLTIVDVEVDLQDISLGLFEQIDALQPCGIGNSEPIFYSRNVRVLSQQRRGKNRACLAMELDRGDGSKIKAIAWRWGEFCPVPSRVDLAYKLRANRWLDTTSVELELVGIRLPEADRDDSERAKDSSSHAKNIAIDKTVSRGEMGTVTPSRGGNCTPHPEPSRIKEISWEPSLVYKLAPSIAHSPQWHNYDSHVMELPQPVLLYGYDRPEQLLDKGGQGDLDRDRPRRTYASIVLWSLPPSITHLQWLIALAKPKSIYVGKQIPVIPTASHLRTQISACVGVSSINLLDLSQQWWVAPCTIVAGFRDLGYSCPNFAPTHPLEVELNNLEQWYRYPIAKLSQLF